MVLPYIAGGMGVSDDEASWAVTTYLVANAVSLTASPYLARRLGRKTFFVACLGLFTLSSPLCAQAWNLYSAPAVPPPARPGGRRHGAGLAVHSGGHIPPRSAASFRLLWRRRSCRRWSGRRSAAGSPTIMSGGGASHDQCPVGLCDAIALIATPLPPAEQKLEPVGRFDVVGFLLISTFLGALNIVLDRGLEDDWFGSNFIVMATAICALAFVLMIPWEVTRRDPLIDLRMVATRQFGASFVVTLATGAIPPSRQPSSCPFWCKRLRLHGHLGRPRAFAGRPRHHW